MMIGQWIGGAQAGLGSFNAILSMAAPVAAAWAIWLIATRRQRRVSSTLVGLVTALVPVVLWSYHAIPGYPRRGALLALGLAVLAGLLALVPARRRVLASGITLAVLALAGLWVWSSMHGETGDRSSRWWYWQAAWDGIGATWPWGGGAWSSFGLAASGNEAARLSAAAGEPIDDPHNLALAMVLDHGVIGLVFVLIMTVLIFRRLGRIADPGDRAAAIALMVALAVVLSVDNCWSLPASRIWLWVLIGVVWSCPVVAAPTVGWQPPLLLRRFALGGCAALILVAIAAEIPAVLLPRSPNPMTIVPAMRATCIPQVATTLLDDAAASPLPNMGGQADLLTSIARERFGPGLPILEHRLIASRFSAQAAVAMTRPDAPGFYDSAVLESWRQRRPQLVEAWLRAAIEVIAVDPFRRSVYADLQAAMLAGGAPGLIPAVVTRRLRILVAGSVADEDLASVDGAADLWAACRGRVMMAQPAAWLQPAVGRLVSRHGRCSGVAELAILAIASDPVAAQVWNADGGRAWNWGLRHLLPDELRSALARVRSQAACQLLAPILDTAFGRVTRPQDDPVLSEIARIQEL